MSSEIASDLDIWFAQSPILLGLVVPAVMIIMPVEEMSAA